MLARRTMRAAPLLLPLLLVLPLLLAVVRPVFSQIAGDKGHYAVVVNAEKK